MCGGNIRKGSSGSTWSANINMDLSVSVVKIRSSWNNFEWRTGATYSSGFLTSCPFEASCVDVVTVMINCLSAELCRLCCIYGGIRLESRPVHCL